ncbi:DUF6368 family protein (plasmid) [Streptomyces sp. NBC_01450]|uniref:DUF6368 family protein n=1 Tax=Streptomyces sp. NBC_01450 TaxID=2903871 RepID=UPI002E2EB340|nr:DUF6368 family protein [Streptomyces sp. NBC_01450]
MTSSRTAPVGASTTTRRPPPASSGQTAQQPHHDAAWTGGGEGEFAQFAVSGAREDGVAEHGDGGDQRPLIGFAPTRAVDVIAFCNSPVDHIATALLTAAIMDLIGGVANAELREDQVSIAAGLPGVVATTTNPWPAAYGSVEFLGAWTEQPGFRLLK